MALFPVSPGLQPLGLFDCKDTDLSSLKGGEVMTLGSASRTLTSTEGAAADVLDGYDYAVTATPQRAVAQIATAASVPVFLSDEGTGPHYFTLLGTVVGSSAGLTVSGTALGIHTGAASGKATLWDKPGLYSVTLDACATDFISSLAGAALAPGAKIGHLATGKLAHGSCGSVVASTGVAHLAEFEGSQSLVTTPARLVGATTLPDRVKIFFHAAMHDRSL